VVQTAARRLRSHGLPHWRSVPDRMDGRDWRRAVNRAVLRARPHLPTAGLIFLHTVVHAAVIFAVCGLLWSYSWINGDEWETGAWAALFVAASGVIAAVAWLVLGVLFGEGELS
jgi:hypothetical protein